MYPYDIVTTSHQVDVTAYNNGNILYATGQTKVFFKAGVLGRLEDQRDEKLSATIALFQAYVRGNLIRRNYQRLVDQR